MCGRYLIAVEEEIIEFRQILAEINERYKDTPLLASMSTGEIFPTNVAPVLVLGKAKPQAALMKWGFPKWQGSGVIINARAESALEKNMFHKSLMERRCVVPTTGFFEWRQEGNSKTKYLFQLQKSKILYLAGLYNMFSAKPSEAYVVLTTAANSQVAPYHHRMPLVLEAENVDAWLSDTTFALDYVQSSYEASFNVSVA